MLLARWGFLKNKIMNQIDKNILASNGLKRKVISENKYADIIFETNRDGQVDRYVVHKFNGDVQSWDILKGLNTRNEIEVYSGARELLKDSVASRDALLNKYESLKTRFVLTVAIGSVIVLGLITALIYAYQS